MKVQLDKDEWYPVYNILAPGDDYYYEDDDHVEVPDELVKKFKMNHASFEEIQEELAKIYKEESL